MAGTLPGMRVRHAFALLLVVAAACGGNVDAGPGANDYFTKLERTSETAYIQERGLGRDLRVRLEEAGLGADRMDAVTVFLDQSARLYQDIVDALRQLHAPPELAAAQRAYLEAWQGQLDLIVKVRDAGFPSSGQVLKELDRPAFRDATKETKVRCEDLQAAVDASGPHVDLDCGGRPS